MMMRIQPWPLKQLGVLMVLAIMALFNLPTLGWANTVAPPAITAEEDMTPPPSLKGPTLLGKPLDNQAIMASLSALSSLLPMASMLMMQDDPDLMELFTMGVVPAPQNPSTPQTPAKKRAMPKTTPPVGLQPQW
jgi:hypothetical protein